MSGPVRTQDVPPDPPAGVPARPEVEVSPARESRVDGRRVLRALPRRRHRTVGAWCFADHIVPGAGALAIGPHPHIGLQTVTWLMAGELLHRDSLGSEQPIRPGRLNLMTAGHGVAHAEEPPPGRAGGATGDGAGSDEDGSAGGDGGVPGDGAGAAAGPHGVQLWVAQPEATRHGPPAFEHHAALPRAEVPHGVATVLVGEFAGAASPARRDTDHMGADLDLAPGATVVGLRRDYEHAVIPVAGAVRAEGRELAPGHLAHLGPGHSALRLEADAPARLLLLGGVPFPEPVLMWWNFVARTHEEVDAARADWQEGTGRFGPVASALPVIPAPVPPWSRPPA